MMAAKRRVSNVNWNGKIKNMDRISFLNAKSSLDVYKNTFFIKEDNFDILQDKSHNE